MENQNSQTPEQHLEYFTNPDLVNPFSETTRRSRRMLILISFLGFATTWAGLIPKKIVPLGIELEPTNIYALLILTAIALVYFLFSFWIYANADLARNEIILRISKNINRKPTEERIRKVTNSAYNKEQRDAKDGRRYYAKIPENIAQISMLKAEIDEQLKLHKVRKFKIYFDKYIPLQAGCTCLIFILFKLYEIQISDGLLVILSLQITLTYTLLLLIFRYKKIISNRVIEFFKPIGDSILLANFKFIEFQIKKSNKSSWLYKRAMEKKKKIAMKKLNKKFKKSDKRANKVRKSKQI